MLSRTRQGIEAFDNQHDFERLAADILNGLGYQDVEPMAPGGGAGGGYDTKFRDAGAQGIAFVTLEKGREATPELKEELRKWVAKEIGALAKPDDIRFTDMLPKTRSGKIMRRLLRELATSGDVKGDTTTLEDFGVIAKLKESDEA